MKALLMRLYYWFLRRWYGWISPNGKGDYAINTLEAITKLRTIWPNLNWAQVENPDAKVVIYSLDKAKEVDQWMIKIILGLGLKWEWLQELFDCDDFALIRKAFDRLHRAKEYHQGKIPKELMYSRAVAEIWGERMMSIKSPHAVNIHLLHEGVKCEEPQNFTYEDANPVTDKPMNIRF